MANEVDFAIATGPQADGSTLVALVGELDLYRLPTLAAALRAATGCVVIDLQEVTFLDSATLALLVQEHQRLQEAGDGLTVLVGEQTPTTVFTVTGIDKILTIRPAAVTQAAEPSAA